MTHFRVRCAASRPAWQWLLVENATTASISLKHDRTTIALGKGLLAIHEELPTFATEAAIVVGVVLRDTLQISVT